MDTKQAKNIAELVATIAGGVMTCIQATSMVKRKLEEKNVKPVRKIGFDIR